MGRLAWNTGYVLFQANPQDSISSIRFDSYGMTHISNIEKATLEDGFSLRDLYADVRFRLTQCDFLPGNKPRRRSHHLSALKLPNSSSTMVPDISILFVRKEI